MDSILKLNLELGESNYTFYLNDRSEIPDLAQDFCKKHNLNKECINFIIEQFNQQISSKTETVVEHSQDQLNETIIEKSLVQQTYESWQQKINDKVLQKQKQNQNSLLSQSKNSSLIQNNYHSHKNSQNTLSSYQSNYRNNVRQKSPNQSINRTPNKSINKSPNKSINRSPNKSINKSPNKSKDPNLHENLYRDADKKRHKLLVFETLKREKQLENCTFTPRINRTSSFLAQKKNEPYEQDDIVQKLYKKDHILKQKTQQYTDKTFKEIHPFQPNPHRKVESKTLSDQQEFAVRKQVEKMKFDREIEKRQIEKQQSQPFHPVINKDQYHYRAVEREKNEIEKFEFQNYLKQEMNKFNKKKALRLHPNIVKEIKAWFSLMDSDQDGFISPDQIDLSQVPNLNILQDLLFYIDENKLTVDLNTFIGLLEERPHILEQMLSMKIRKHENVNSMYQRLIQL